MKVVTVMPIAKGVFLEELTYFSAVAPEVGTLVKVAVRGRAIPGLVLSVVPAETVKSGLRQAGYPLKKLMFKGGSDKNSAKHLFSSVFIEAVGGAARHFVAALGPTLKSVSSQIILNRYLEPATILPVDKSDAAQVRPDRVNKIVFQGTDEDRLAFYKSLVRSEFARGASVFLVCPNALEVERAAKTLAKGINTYLLILHHKLSERDLWDNWRRALESVHPVLVIVTPTFIFLPRRDIGAIIVDRENSSGYKEMKRPYVDYRKFAEILAEAGGWKLVYGDTALRAETIFRAERGQFFAASPLKPRLFSAARQELAPVIREEDSADREFKALSPRLSALIAQAARRGDKTLILVGRRGLAPLILCQDCGEAVMCRRCRSPLVLHRVRTDTKGGAGDYLLLCHKCQETRAVEERCANCGGWRLEQFGIGIERVENELKKIIPEPALFRLDSDVAKTPKQAKAVVAKFLADPQGVLLGTELALYYLAQKVDNVFVAAIDGLFTLPDFRINERLFGWLSRARLLAERQFIIQTKHPEWPIFSEVIRGGLLEFYQKEIIDRERFGYPPFKQLIKITRRGKRQEIILEMKKLEASLASYEPEVFPAFTSEVKGQFVMHALLRLNPERGPDEELYRFLRNLPPRFIVNVDPESIL